MPIENAVDIGKVLNDRRKSRYVISIDVEGETPELN